MYNWSVDEKRFKKENPKGYRLWRLIQLINYGLGGEKLATITKNFYLTGRTALAEFY